MEKGRMDAIWIVLKYFVMVIVVLFNFFGKYYAEQRIIGGRLASKGEFPFVVLLQDPTTYNETDTFCGGAILNKFFVMAACGCVAEADHTDLTGPIKYLNYSDVRVIAGSLYSVIPEEQGYQLRWVFFWRHHPLCFFDKYNYRHDVAVIKITQPFIFNQFVSPITIPKDVQAWRDSIIRMVLNGGSCVVTGWGYTVLDPATKQQSIGISLYLRVLDLHLTDPRICFRAVCLGNNDHSEGCVDSMIEAFKRGQPIDRICADAYKTDNGTSYLGDGGGLLVCENYPTGIVSANCFVNCGKPFAWYARFDTKDSLSFISEYLVEENGSSNLIRMEFAQSLLFFLITVLCIFCEI